MFSTETLYPGGYTPGYTESLCRRISSSVSGIQAGVRMVGQAAPQGFSSCRSSPSRRPLDALTLAGWRDPLAARPAHQISEMRKPGE